MLTATAHMKVAFYVARNVQRFESAPRLEGGEQSLSVIGAALLCRVACLVAVMLSVVACKFLDACSVSVPSRQVTFVTVATNRYSRACVLKRNGCHQNHADGCDDTELRLGTIIAIRRSPVDRRATEQY